MLSWERLSIMPLARAHAIVTGIVQGVAFRWSARDRASELNLTGWVRNRRDGSVEAVFEGEKDDIEQMLAWCNHGPISAVVENVDVEWQPPRGEFRAFCITR